MKYMKKLLALALAVMLVMSLATTAFAATITIEDGVITDASYSAYKLLNATDGGDGKFAYTVNSTYSAALKKVTGKTTDADIVAYIAALDANGVRTFADAVFAEVKSMDADAVATDNVFSNIDQGYYLIVETATGTTPDTMGDDSYSLVMLDTAGEEAITVDTKENVPEVTKNIVEEDGYAGGTKDDKADLVDTNEVSIGDTVNYEIQGSVSSKVESYKEYYYLFTDTLSAGLTLTDPDGEKTNDIKVTIGNVDVTEHFTISTAAYAGTNDAYKGGTVITISIADLLSLEEIDADEETEGVQPLVDITADTKVVVTYSATLNEKAKIDSPNPNKVDLTYSRNPYYESDGDTSKIPTGVTPPDEVETYSTEVKINKVIGGTTTPLPGAEFTITGDNAKIVIVTKEVFTAYKEGATVDTNNQYWKLTDGTYTTTAPTTAGIDTSVYASTETSYYKETVTEVKNTTSNEKATSVVDKDGYAAFTGLGVGTYTIEETKVPAGYNKAANSTVKITFDFETKKFSYKWNDGTTDSNNSVTIENNSGTELPSTGGMGTTIFYTLGGFLVVAAVVLLVTKKRMSVAE